MQLQLWSEVCGWALARAHARAGDAAEIAGYLGASDTFDRAVAAFSEAYANQAERDYKALLAAIKSGRIVAATAGI
jgi:NAD(P)H-dependent flavin oxidoreductase YrpB (nitropropane dioxygenase family)